MKKLVLLFSLILLSSPLLASIAFAAVKEGEKEISVFGSLTTVDPEVGEEISVLILVLSGGLFISDNSQVGGSITNIGIFNSFESTNLLLDGFYKYHFNPEEEVVPYLGGQAGFGIFGTDVDNSTSISYGGMAGFKFFVSEDLSFNGEFNLKFTTQETAGEDLDVTLTILQVGISYYF